MCRRAKLTPKDVAIAGTFLAETIFATCHTLSLITVPGSPGAQSGVRGEGRARHGVRTLALTLARARPPPSLAELPMWMQSDVARSTPFRARTPKLPGWQGFAFAGKLGKFFPTFNSGAQGPGLQPRGGAGAPPPRAHPCPPPNCFACTSLSPNPLSTAGIWIQPRKLLPA